MNRQQRRTLEKALRKKGGGGGPLSKAADSVKKAVDKLDKVGEFDETMDEVRALMEKTGAAVVELADDFDKLMGELRAQREINIRLLTIIGGHGMPERDLNSWSDDDLEIVRALESSLREKYLAAQRSP